MKKSNKLLSLLGLPLLLASCSGGDAVIDEREIHDWIKNDNEVFEKLGATYNDKMVTMPYDKDLFISYEIRTPDEKGGEDTITYQSNYAMFYNMDINKIIFTLEIDNVDKIDNYFETVKKTTGWVVDENKSDASEHDYYAYHELDYTKDDFGADQVKSTLRLNAYPVDNLMYVSTFVETDMTFASWPEDAINDTLQINIDKMKSFRSFKGNIEQIKFTPIRLGGVDYVNLKVTSSDANALSDYHNHLKDATIIANPNAKPEDQVKESAWQIEDYHDFSKTKTNYYLNQTYFDTNEGTNYRFDTSLNIYLDKDVPGANQKEFSILLNMQSVPTFAD